MFRLFAILVLSFLLATCGGDPKVLKLDDIAGEKGTTDKPEKHEEERAPGSVKGNVIDGPLYNAMVYLDINGNGKWEDGEPYAVTDHNGKYELKAEPEELSKYNLLVEMSATTVDTETNKSLGAYTMTYLSPSARDELSGSLGSYKFSINAFTSMIQDEIEQGVSPDRAVKNIGLLLGLRERYHHLLLVDFWAVKTTGKINDVKVKPDVLKVVIRLHNIARVYARVLSKKLKEVTEDKSYTVAQKGYITHLVLDVLKQKLKGVMATDDKIVGVDLLAEELAEKIPTENVAEMVAKHNFNVPPNRPTITNQEDTFSLAQAKGTGVELLWKMYYGENGSQVLLMKMPEEKQIATKYLSADTPNVQSGSFTLKLDKESVYSYKVCLKNNNGKTCSADFRLKVVKQAEATATSGSQGSVRIFPLLPEGDPKLRPGKPTWNGWMQGIKNSKFIKKGEWYNAAWSKWSGLIADEYTFLRCYDKKSYNSGAATGGYVCDDVKVDKEFKKKALHTWDHWIDGRVVGKAGGQTAKVATQVTMFNDNKLYRLEGGKEKGVFYVHQIKLCRTANGRKHCSVSDPLKLYVTKANGKIAVTPKSDPTVKDRKGKEIEVPRFPEIGDNEDTGEGAKISDPVPPGQKEDTKLSSSGSQDTADQTPLAVATVNYVSGSWKAFDQGTDNIEVKITKYYGNVGLYWKIAVYRYNLGAKIDEANLPTAYETVTGRTSTNAVPEEVSFSYKFGFNKDGLYAFKGFLCDGVPSASGTFCQPSSNLQVVQVGGVKKAVKVAVPALPTGEDNVAGAEPKYEALTDEEYVRQEDTRRSTKLKEAIKRIRTLPLSKHEIVNGKDLGPDLNQNFANVTRVKRIFLEQFDKLQTAQTDGKIKDFDTSGLGTLSDFRKGELAWQWLFPMANGHIKQFPDAYNKNVADGDYPYTYTNFLKAIAKYPRLCSDKHGSNTGSDNVDALCKLSMAMMFAHFAQEVGGHLGDPTNDYKLPFSEKLATPSGQIGKGGSMKTFECKEIPGQVTGWCQGFINSKDQNGAKGIGGGVSMVNQVIPEYRQALYWVNESGCSENGAGCEYRSCTPGSWQAEAWPCPATTKYFGRGPKQLSYNYNYGPFSDIIFGDVNVLLKDPARVTEGWLAFGSAVYFFMQPRPPKPSMYELIYGYWIPNQTAKNAKLGRNMGTSIMIINGGIECGGSEAVAQADNRVKYYSGFLDYFGMIDRIDLTKRTNAEYSCKSPAAQFGPEHGANYLNSWAKDWTGTCKIVGWETAYSGFRDGAFKQCFEREILGR
jgi:chitodextrinase